MPKSVTLEMRHGWVLQTLPADYQITRESQKANWEQLSTFCLQHKCYKVLSVAQRPERCMTTVDAYDSGQTISVARPGLRLACVWAEYQPDEITRFFENVTANRGVQVKFCQTYKEAGEWLELTPEEAADLPASAQ